VGNLREKTACNTQEMMIVTIHIKMDFQDVGWGFGPELFGSRLRNLEGSFECGNKP
jgi:hypothetical protein